MDSDFRALSEKISQLAELTQQLRRENADLRLRITALASENTEMSQKMLQVKQRVTTLMDRYPESSAKENAS